MNSRTSHDPEENPAGCGRVSTARRSYEISDGRKLLRGVSSSNGGSATEGSPRERFSHRKGQIEVEARLHDKACASRGLCRQNDVFVAVHGEKDHCCGGAGGAKGGGGNLQTVIPGIEMSPDHIRMHAVGDPQDARPSFAAPTITHSGVNTVATQPSIASLSSSQRSARLTRHGVRRHNE